MALSDAEKAVVLELAKDLEILLPKLVEAELAKVPAPYGALLIAGFSAVQPQLVEQMDKLIQAKLG